MDLLSKDLSSRPMSYVLSLWSLVAGWGNSYRLSHLTVRASELIWDSNLRVPCLWWLLWAVFCSSWWHKAPLDLYQLVKLHVHALPFRELHATKSLWEWHTQENTLLEWCNWDVGWQPSDFQRHHANKLLITMLLSVAKLDEKYCKWCLSHYFSVSPEACCSLCSQCFRLVTWTSVNLRHCKLQFRCRCPFAQRVRVVLEEKGLPYEQIFVDGSNKDEEFLKLTRDVRSNPHHSGAVPAMIGRHILEPPPPPPPSPLPLPLFFISRRRWCAGMKPSV